MAVKQIAKINYDVNTVSSIYDIQALGLNYKTGSGTAAVTETPFCFSKWDVTDTSIAEYYNGLTIAFKVPVAGNGTYGTCLQINNLGYHPVVRATNSMIGTRYGVGAIVLLVYTTSLSGSVYGTSAGVGASAAANISGVWVCVNDADNNSNTLLRTYASSADIELPIAGMSTGSTTPSTSTYTSGYKDSYGQIPSTVANRPTINLSTGVLTVPAGIDGTATRATADANGNNIASTYATKTHSHGKINSDGTITLSGTGNGTASIVTNGRFLITQNDGRIYASQLAFNTTTTDYAKYALTQYGTWEEFGSGSGTFIIKMSYNSNDAEYYLDKDADEIDQAYEDGIPMIVYTTFNPINSREANQNGLVMFNLSEVEHWPSGGHQYHMYTFTMADTTPLMCTTRITTEDSSGIYIDAPYVQNVALASHVHGYINRYGQIGTISNRALYTLNTGTITSGTLPIAAGGTGATTSAAALTNLGAAAATHYHDDRYLQLSGGTMTGALTLSGDPTSNLQAATKQYVDQSFAANDAMVFQGTIGPSGSTVTALPASHSAGDTYRVNVSVTTSYAGQACENGDLIICIRDGSSASNDDWTVVQTNLDGAVIGPASATDGRIATFSGSSGTLIQDSGYTTASFAVSTHSHGNITNDGKVGTTSNKALYTGTSGTVTSGTLPVAAGGTGTTSFTANSLIMSGSTTTAALTTRSIKNNTSSATTTTGTDIPTMSTLYYGLAVINNATQQRNVSVYAPTSGGSAGQLLTASGTTSAPVWTNTGNITVGAAIKDGAGNTISTYYAAGTHSHGYISSTGTISLSGTNPGTTTIENGSRLMITNASGTIFASRLSFNTTSNIYANNALTQYGTWEEFSKGVILRTWTYTAGDYA